MEIINKISKDEFKHKIDYPRNFEGYVVETDKQVIKFGVSSGQDCCESFGYLTTNDDIEEFIGADLLGITQTDTSLNTKRIADEVGSLDEGDIMFINLETNRGTLQFVAYNSHNGFYGHTGIIVSEQLTEVKDL